MLNVSIKRGSHFNTIYSTAEVHIQLAVTDRDFDIYLEMKCNNKLDPGHWNRINAAHFMRCFVKSLKCCAFNVRRVSSP